MANVFQNVSSALVNASNRSSWMPQEIEELAIGHNDALHVFALLLGTPISIFGQQSPQILSGVAGISFGIWLGLVMRDRQRFNEPFMGKYQYPQGMWFPIVCGLFVTCISNALVLVAWRAALALLTSGLLMLLVLASARLLNASPERVIKIGFAAMSAYRMVGMIVLVIFFAVSMYGVIKHAKPMMGFTSACLGSLLVLSGLSHFSQRVGLIGSPDQAAFSLLDDLARVLSEVRGGRCHIWSETGQIDDDGLRGCDCSDLCRVEIIVWFVTTLGIFLSRFVGHRALENYGYGDKYTSLDEREHLNFTGLAASDLDPVPDVLGAKHD